MKRLLFAYQDKKYKNIAKVMFKKCLYEFLWSFTIIGGIITVSYTHLDVYKRQD